MENVTKEHALEKLDGMKAFVAYTNDILDDDKLGEYYKDLKIHPDSFLKTSLSNRFDIDERELKNQNNPIIRNAWIYKKIDGNYMNAFYRRDFNALGKLFSFLFFLSS